MSFSRPIESGNLFHFREPTKSKPPDFSMKKFLFSYEFSFLFQNIQKTNKNQSMKKFVEFFRAIPWIF